MHILQNYPQLPAQVIYNPCSNAQFQVHERSITGIMAVDASPDSNVHGANMGPIWGREDPGGPHVGPMSFAIWVLGPRCGVGMAEEDFYVAGVVLDMC